MKKNLSKTNLKLTNSKKHKKASETFKRLIITLLLIFSIVLCSSLALGFTTIEKNKLYAEQSDPGVNAGTHNLNISREKYFKSIEIAKGDSLWIIAEEYLTEEYSSIPIYIKEVKSINNLSSEDIHEGEYITIPYYANIY